MVKNVLYKLKGLIAVYIIMGLVSQLMNVLSIVYFQRIIDILSEIKNKADITDYISIPLLLYAITTIACCILNYADNYPSTKIENRIYYNFKILAIDKVSKINFLDYANYGTGKIIQIVENGSEAGKNILFGFFIEIFYSLVPGLLFSLIVLGTYSIRIMFVIGIGYVVIFIVSNLMLKKLYNIKEKVLIETEWTSNKYVRALMETMIFRVNRKYKQEKADIGKAYDEIIKSETKVVMIHEFFFAFFYLLVIFVKIIIIIMGIWKLNISLGKIVALVMLVDNIYSPISEFNIMYVKYNLDKVAYNRYVNFLSLRDDTNLFNGIELMEKPFKIKAVNFSAGYGRRDAVHNLSYEMEAGKKYAIVGKSGAGKSTYVKTLLGIIKGTKGNLFINESDISTINLDKYYQYISYVSQDAPIFDGTILENITMNKEYAHEEIWSVLDMVLLKEKIEGLDKRLETNIGEKGIKLSGGEKQKLAIARVLLQDASVIILDEATASMDYLSEEKVLQNLFSEKKDSLILLITHRLKAIEFVDKIFLLENGEIREEGSFAQLIKNRSDFYELWNKHAEQQMK